MKRLTRTLVLLGVLGIALCLVFTDAHKNRASQLLPMWTHQNDDVAFVACNKKWKPFDASLLKNALIKVTVWSPSKSKRFYSSLLKSVYENKRTAVVFPTLTQGQNACLRSGVSRRRLFLSVDWIVFNDEDDSVTKMQRHLRYFGKCPACVVPHGSAVGSFAEKSISQKGRPVVFSPRCFSRERNRRSTWTDAFSGATISYMCYVDDSNRHRKKTSFGTCYSHPIAEALRNINATMIFKEPNETHDKNEKLYQGEVDINLRFMHRIRHVSTPQYSFPYIAYYRYERFYAYSGDGDRLISSFTVLGESQALLALLLLSGATVWLALSAAGSITSGASLRGRVKWYVILDAATFTISSLLSTSASSVCDRTLSRSRFLSRTTVGIVRAVWLLAMIPLSFYFRAVLTARLSVYVPPNPIDTLDELEAHLDSAMIQPCLVKHSAVHADFWRSKFPRGSIYIEFFEPKNILKYPEIDAA